MGIWTKDGSIDQMAILAKKQKWHEGKSERVGVVTRWPTIKCYGTRHKQFKYLRRKRTFYGGSQNHDGSENPSPGKQTWQTWRKKQARFKILTWLRDCTIYSETFNGLDYELGNPHLFLCFSTSDRPSFLKFRKKKKERKNCKWRWCTTVLL